MITALYHVGISVTDINRAIAFYCEAFGMEVALPPKPFDGEQYSKLIGLANVSGLVALVQLGDMQLELFQFENPAPKARDPNYPASDHGITHICFSVKDIDSEYERIKALGARFNSPPLPFFGTAKATYGRDLDGNIFELTERGLTL